MSPRENVRFNSNDERRKFHKSIKDELTDEIIKQYL